MTKVAKFAAFALVLFACGLACTEEFKPPPQKDEPVKRQVPASPDPVAEKKSPADAAPIVEPTTPEEITLARKAAVLEGRAEDAVKYCGLEGVDAMGEQAILGCVLAACRAKDVTKSQEWGKKLSGPLKKEALKVCDSYSMSL